MKKDLELLQQSRIHKARALKKRSARMRDIEIDQDSSTPTM